MALCKDPHKVGCMRPVLNDGMVCDTCYQRPPSPPQHSPDEERVERAAKALWAVQSELKLVSFDLLGPDQRNELCKQARAALAAAEREGQ